MIGGRKGRCHQTPLYPTEIRPGLFPLLVHVGCSVGFSWERELQVCYAEVCVCVRDYKPCQGPLAPRGCADVCEMLYVLKLFWGEGKILMLNKKTCRTRGHAVPYHNNMFQQSVCFMEWWMFPPCLLHLRVSRCWVVLGFLLLTCLCSFLLLPLL